MTMADNETAEEIELGKRLAKYIADPKRSVNDMKALGATVQEHIRADTSVRPPDYFLLLGNKAPHFLVQLLVGYYAGLDA
jgi:hypothetical protein